MLTSNIDDLNKKIASYFQCYFNNNHVDVNTRLIDIGFESIHYIELAAFLFKITSTWLDISKINNDTKIFNIASYLLNLNPEKKNHQTMVKLDTLNRFFYSSQLNNEQITHVSYIIHCLHLKEGIDTAKLKIAIENTLNNHFLLNSKLIRIIDDYYFENAQTQSDLTFKGSILFPKRDIARLIIKVHSDRLVNIYLQRKRKQYYLIISFHHIVMDGWSHKILQEEIFRRYAGLYNLKIKKASEDIPALNKIYPSSMNEKSNTDELATILKLINPNQYNQLDHWFYGKLQVNYNCFTIKKEEMDQYARTNNIHGAPYSVVFAFMLHQIISQASGINKLIIYLSLSNRHLPIPEITGLVTNMITCLPLFLDNTNSKSQEFAEKINETLKIYFKHMSYGALTRILLENNTLLNTYINPYRHPYCIMLTYINNTSKIIYGNDSITSNYINWNKSRTHICNEGKLIFFEVHNLGAEFVVHVHSRMLKGVHFNMLHNFLKLNFPSVLSGG